MSSAKSANLCIRNLPTWDTSHLKTPLIVSNVSSVEKRGSLGFMQIVMFVGCFLPIHVYVWSTPGGHNVIALICAERSFCHWHVGYLKTVALIIIVTVICFYLLLFLQDQHCPFCYHVWFVFCGNFMWPLYVISLTICTLLWVTNTWLPEDGVIFILLLEDGLINLLLEKVISAEDQVVISLDCTTISFYYFCFMVINRLNMLFVWLFFAIM